MTPNDVINRADTAVTTDELKVRETIAATTINAFLASLSLGSDRTLLRQEDIKPLCDMLDAALSLAPPKRPRTSIEKTRDGMALARRDQTVAEVMPEFLKPKPL